MTITEAFSRSATEDKPVHCPKSRARKHANDCLCRGTGWVKACLTCSGSGFNPVMQQVCVGCGGAGAMSFALPKTAA
jgi:hypothetical protein